MIISNHNLYSYNTTNYHNIINAREHVPLKTINTICNF